ncbi:Aste57867_2462 [Aphanomyces stellatus]|uniref:Aste57867_2462 protein n=1 Tax=Aphanomyces stellatus TaxID=120398 RepID=A0A485KA58_9STRA|nr:hypothetical protein As57867_002456 [Aphanomyces stellatus]VFT79662.1 Aste57867_2462 [Aphanomyces stellatus]
MNTSRRLCWLESCTNDARPGKLQCYRHRKKQPCTTDGCPNMVNKKGVCVAHGARQGQCKVHGCHDKQLRVDGRCYAHWKALADGFFSQSPSKAKKVKQTTKRKVESKKTTRQTRVAKSAIGAIEPLPWVHGFDDMVLLSESDDLYWLTVMDLNEEDAQLSIHSDAVAMICDWEL